MGETDLAKGTRRCGKCGEEKPLTTEFFHRSIPRHGGFTHCCKPCESERRRHRLLKPYGLTPGSYADLLAAQGGVCAVCKTPPQGVALAVDHDHNDGRVRDLLCRRCNQALGHAYDDPALFRALADYLEKAVGFLPERAPKKRMSRYVFAPIVDGKRACSDCGVMYPLTDEFYYRAAKFPAGFAYPCKSCSRESARWRNMARLYGLTREGYAALLEVQGGGCAICKKSPTGGRVPQDGGALLDIDHDHTTGRIRGALCRRCNLSLGRVGDDVALLRALADYLEAHA